MSIAGRTLTAQKLDRLLDPNYPLRREEVIWLLDWIKKKVAEKDPQLPDLSGPRLLQIFHSFAQTAMALIHQSVPGDQEVDRLRTWIREAVRGLLPEETAEPPRNKRSPFAD